MSKNKLIFGLLPILIAINTTAMEEGSAPSHSSQIVRNGFNHTPVLDRASFATDANWAEDMFGVLGAASKAAVSSLGKMGKAAANFVFQNQSENSAKNISIDNKNFNLDPNLNVSMSGNLLEVPKTLAKSIIDEVQKAPQLVANVPQVIADKCEDIGRSTYTALTGNQPTIHRIPYTVVSTAHKVVESPQDAAKLLGKGVATIATKVKDGMIGGENEDFIKFAVDNVFDPLTQQLKDGKAKEFFTNATQNLNANSTEIFQTFGNNAKDTLKKIGDEFNEQSENFAVTIEEQAENFVTHLKDNVKDLMGGDIKTLMGYGTVAAITVITAYYGSKVGWDYFNRFLKTPKLIIKSSKKSLFQRLKNLVLKEPVEKKEMVLEDNLKKELTNILHVTRTIASKIKNGDKSVKYRNLLLWGLPGTGKTMFAEKLARMSGMEFVTMSGASFAKFKKGEGIKALDDLFAWANKSKGLMIFVDEAETFLAKREGSNPNDESYLLLNNFLNYTGERSDKFMFAFATNHPKVLDPAMERRIDDSIEMKLPGAAQRAQTLGLYIEKCIMSPKQDDEEYCNQAKKLLDGLALTKIATETDGMSYGDLEGIVNNIKTDADATESGLITLEIIENNVAKAIRKHQNFINNFAKPSASAVAA